MTTYNRLLVGTALCLFMAAPNAARAEAGGASAAELIEEPFTILAQADDPEGEPAATDCPAGSVLEGGECVPVEEEEPTAESPGEETSPEEAPPATEEPEAEPAEEPVDEAPPEEEEAAPVETEETPPAEPEETPSEPSDTEDASEPEAETPAETEPEAEVETEMDEPTAADESAEEPAAAEEDAPVEAQEAPENDPVADGCPAGMTMSATDGECVPAEEETTDEQPTDEVPAEEEPAQPAQDPAEEEPAQVEDAGEDEAEAESTADEQPVDEQEPTAEPDESADEPAADAPVSDEDTAAEEELDGEPADDATPEDGEPVTEDEEGAAESDEAAPEADSTEEGLPEDTDEEQPADAEEAPDSDEEAQEGLLNPEQVRQEIREIVEEEGEAIELGQTPEDQRVRRGQFYQQRENARVVEEYNDNRTIVEINNNVYVEHPDYDRLVLQDDHVYYERLPGERVREVIERRDGTRVITIRNRYGDVVRRVRVTPDGREYVLAYVPDDRFDSVVRFEDPARDLPPFRLTIPESDYILEAQAVEEPDRYYTFLDQPPVEPVPRLYSLEEVQYSARVRDMMGRIDLTTIEFEFGSAQIDEREIAELEALADAMLRLLDEDPAETFLIEGHTDAVGSELANLALSDRRAESVARALTNVFGLPPENLVTQGYGEQFLKVDTEDRERSNRRVAIRRITPLVSPVASR
ncbi:OmpA family protein [Chelativorans sp. YIM 93263]|uniref:OmpA family protein n=1 Tax=Chelativorans sp. YIM 93263 TaxID=2906648 RepID=UPI002379F348|nr:OmpA family protein [Chelativorans sp. YIM 93263]